MGHYQVLFSGQVGHGADVEVVRKNLARELGIDDRKAKQLFSGRTVVIRSQLTREDALAVQNRFADFGALCRIKDLTPQDGRKLDYRVDRADRDAEHTLRDITAAHVECPRCGHLQLEACHCARCGIDIGAAIKAKRKEDLIIEKKLRELRAGRAPASTENVAKFRFTTASDRVAGEQGKRGKIASWLRKIS